MLLIVIAALCVALVVQQRRAARRETELRRDGFPRGGIRQPLGSEN